MQKSHDDLLAEIDALLAEIQSKRPLNEGELQELRKSLKVDFTYNSNAIEGNTLTRGETKIVLEEGLTIDGKPLREIHETVNHNAIFDWLFTLIDAKEDLSEQLILQLHQFVLKNIDDENAGRYRQIQVSISGEESLPPSADEVPELMADLIQWYQQEKDTMHPALFAAVLHEKFVDIHPFIDGNGRTVRILINIHLMQRGYPLVIIPVSRRADYLKSLHSSASEGSFTQFFLEVVRENLKDYRRMVDVEVC